MSGCLTASLSGKKTSNPAYLGGTFELGGETIPNPVKEIQQLIMENIVLPLVSSKWKTIEENLFLVDLLNVKMDYYLKIYPKIPSLQIYKDVLAIYKNVLNEHIQLRNLENGMYGSCTDNLINIVYKTAMINLKPEYSLYNLILGSPDIANGKGYNQDIINDILELLSLNNINYQKIKETIIKKWDS
jgi:hypothetical protein